MARRDPLKLIDTLLLSNTDSNASLMQLYDLVEEFLCELYALRDEVVRLREIEGHTQQLIRDLRRKSTDGVRHEMQRLETLCAFPRPDGDACPDAGHDPFEPDPNKTQVPFKPGS